MRQIGSILSSETLSSERASERAAPPVAPEFRDGGLAEGLRIRIAEKRAALASLPDTIKQTHSDAKNRAKWSAQQRRLEARLFNIKQPRLF
jgi:hypothetical protein